MKVFAKRKGSKWRICEVLKVSRDNFYESLRMSGDVVGVPMIWTETYNGKVVTFPRPAVYVELEVDSSEGGSKPSTS